MPYKNEHTIEMRPSKDFKIFRMKQLGDGVNALLGKGKGKGATMQVVSFRLDKQMFKDKDAVNKWLEKNKMSPIKVVMAAD